MPSNTKLPKTKLQLKRKDRTKIPSHSQVLGTSRFHLNKKSRFYTLFYSHFIILCVLFTSLVVILQITCD